MADLYAILGVPKTADAAAIKRAYRKLAKELHPDRNKDNPRATDRFKAVTAAYDILADEKKRAAYDRGEIDSEGNPRGPQFDPRAWQNARRPGGSSSRGDQSWSTGDGFSFRGDPSDLFAELFGEELRRAAGTGAGGRAGGTRGGPRKGADVGYRLEVPFRDAALATPQRVTLGSGKTIDLKIPPGVTDGQQLRLSGQGEPGPGGPGDAIVTISIGPDPRFAREGDDIRMELPVPLETAVLGGKVRVPTVGGDVMLAIQPGTSSGKLMRLKGKGFSRRSGGRGDQLARVMVEVPAEDEGLTAFLRERQSATAGA
jgi:DnaJ-class molecular chaperone